MKQDALDIFGALGWANSLKDNKGLKIPRLYKPKNCNICRKFFLHNKAQVLNLLQKGSLRWMCGAVRWQQILVTYFIWCTQLKQLHAVGWGEGPWALVTLVKAIWVDWGFKKLYCRFNESREDPSIPFVII